MVRRLVGLVLSLSLIRDLGHVARVAVHVVGDLLQATVGKLHVVGPLGVVAVAGLLVAVVVGGVVVLHDPVEVVLSWRLICKDNLQYNPEKTVKISSLHQ